MSHPSSSHRVRRRAPVVVTAALALAGVVAVPVAVSDPGGNGNGQANGLVNNPNALQFDLLADKSNNGGGPKNPKDEPPGRGDCKNDNSSNPHKQNRGKHRGYECDQDATVKDPDPDKDLDNTTIVNNTTINQAASTAAPAAQVTAQSVRKACLSRRSFRIRIRTRKADPVVRASVTVNGRKVQTVRGRRVTAPVKLTGLPKGRTLVRITAKTKSGKTLKGTRTYHPCTPKRKKTIPDL